VSILADISRNVNQFFEENILFDTLQVKMISHRYHKAKKSSIRNHPTKYLGIQINSTDYINALAFDCDHEDVLEFSDFNLPVPTITIVNKNNGRHHHLYYLKNPIPLFTATEKTKDYLVDLYDGLTHTLQADYNYTGIITKNFINTQEYKVFGSLQKYELNDFKDYTAQKKLSLKNAKLNELKQTTFSRHIKLFDEIRFYGYGIAKESKTYDELHNDLTIFANKINSTFEHQIKVTYIVNCVANFCWENKDNFNGNSWNWDGYTKKSKEEVSLSHKIRHQKNWKERLTKKFSSQF
jgi:hypothetical protein